MSDDIIQGLLAKRAAIASQLQVPQSGLYHLDATLALLGHAPGAKKAARLFAIGELIALVGEAERAGNKTPVPILDYITRIKGLNPSDAVLRKRLLTSVEDCRKRMNRSGV